MKLRKIVRRVWALHAVAAERGDCQLRDFLGAFTDPPPPPDKADRLGINKVQMIKLLMRIAETGPPRNVDISHQIEDGIYQLEKGGIRALYFYGVGKTLIFSHGFEKSTRKTPESEKARVRKARSNYLDAQANGTLVYLEE